jgi:phosphoenolpyruvate synthase/pyruvate phosphate dikinase
MLKLYSKAKTLKNLKEVITKAKVLPLLIIKAKDYNNNKDAFLKECLDYFDTDLIVRSSSASEDNLETSNAGGFDTVLNVKLDKKSINKAILKVINSYENVSSSDEVFIQPMLTNVTMSGVLFTSDIDTLAPYYIINYDKSGSTSSVTEGSTNNLETCIVYKNFDYNKDAKIKLLIQSAKECEKLFDNQFLDIEFAFSNDELYILQTRAIVTKNKNNLNSINLDNILYKAYKKIEKLNIKHPKLLGKKTIFGVMPDWNPAEIIGTRPKRLALSLYKELVTDEIWAYQRDNYGYRNLRSFPLLVSFFGIPFIDVRVSFNSFIPKTLNENIASKLVDFYIDELSNNTNYHDKIEFEIVYSCYFFGLSKKLKYLRKKGFNKNELKRIEFSLLELTNNIIDTKNGLYKKDINKIDSLKDNYDSIVNSSLSIIDKIYWLIEDCKRFGTLPFAGVARAAFIAVQFLNSMVTEKIITKEEYDLFLNSLNTVSKQLNKDKQILPKEEFLKIYGHLRPGTYDITSARYDEDYDKYFSESIDFIEDEEFKFSKKQKKLLQNLLDENGINSSVNNFLQFLKEAIEGREYLKFIFTRHVSKVLQYIEDLGKKHDISRKNMAFVDIKEIIQLYSTLDHRDVRDILLHDINKNKEFFQYTKAIKLPSLILNEEDIFIFYISKNEPNFITQKVIQSDIEIVSNVSNESLSNKIVCIESADPGFDYLFTKGIVGLVTCYGGANSHMAIRCAELGIPAVIGCGDNNFNIYKKANILNIDCLNKQIKVIS